MEFAPKLQSKESLNEVETRRTLESTHLKRLMFLSYMFSQGDQEVQLNLFRWIKQYYGMQSFEVVEDAHKQFVSAQFKDSETAKVESANTHATGHVTEAVLNRDLEFLSFLSNEMTQDEIPDLAYIQTEMYKIDLHYLNREGGRPNRNPEGKENTIADPYFSFVVQYLVRKERTGDEALDALCKQLAEEVAAVDKESAESLIGLYNKTHPDTPLTLEELAVIYQNTIADTVDVKEAA